PRPPQLAPTSAKDLFWRRGRLPFSSMKTIKLSP
ncbi:MAG: hypothetical protein ACI9VS_002681, partial [Candidatus Binatia bacterium]